MIHLSLVRYVVPFIAAAILGVAVLACGDSEEMPAPASTQPAAPESSASPVSPIGPTSTPAVAAPAPAPSPTAEIAKSAQREAKITVAAPFHPMNNGAIHTDDAFILSRLGVTENPAQD